MPHSLPILHQAISLHQQGRLEQALTEYRRVIAISPQELGAYQAIGELLLKLGRPAEAVQPLMHLVQTSPNLSGGWMMLGNAWAGAGDLDRAVEAFSRVAQLAPHTAAPLYAIAEIENNGGRPHLAVQPLLSALKIEPNNPAIHNLLARVYTALAQHAEALPHHQRVAELLPNVDSALSNFAVALHRVGQIGQAERQLRKAIAINPSSAVALTNLGGLLREQGRATEARGCYQQAMSLRPESSPINSIYLYTLHFDPEMDETTIQQEHRKWATRHLANVPKIVRTHPVDAEPDRRLRVGYVSADFRQHVVGRFIEPILRAHDRKQLEIVCYSDTTAVDEMTDRLRRLSDSWRDTAGLNDDQLAHLIAQDQIDILLDTTGHMDGSRLGTFARQPAPVLIGHIGYPASSGVPQIQFRVTDRSLDPAPIAGSHERLLYLPDSFYLYANELQLIPAETPPIVQNGFATFGSLNSPAKTSDAAIALWARAMHATPGSKFLLIVPPDLSVNDSLANRFAACNIARSRMIFEPARSFDQYLNLYNRVDIVLDPQPYGGGITNCDALWMGVPIVSLFGKTSVGRIGTTILRSLGLDELVAETPEQYSQIAAKLASDPAQLTEYRRTLRHRLRRSPLMDAGTYTANLEKLYRQAWCECRQMPPR